MNETNLLAWQGVFVFVALLVVASVLTATFLHHHRQVVKARAGAADADAYRQLVATTTTEVARLADEIEELKRSVAEMARLLREVG